MSDASPRVGRSDSRDSRAHSVGGTARKKVGAKRKLSPGQSLLPDLFNGLFKPPSVAKYVGVEEKLNCAWGRLGRSVNGSDGFILCYCLGIRT